MSQSPERREAPRADAAPAPAGGDDLSCKLFIANLTYNTRARDLEDVFEKYGRVKDVHIAEDRDTGRSKGFAFITMSNAQEAADAVASANGAEVDGRPIKVELSDGGRNRRPRDNNRDFKGDRRGGGRSDVCYDWQAGRCSRGTSCRFSHDDGSRRDDDRRDDRRRGDSRDRGDRRDRYDDRRHDDRRGGYDDRRDDRRDDRDRRDHRDRDRSRDRY